MEGPLPAPPPHLPPAWCPPGSLPTRPPAQGPSTCQASYPHESAGVRWDVCACQALPRLLACGSRKDVTLGRTLRDNGGGLHSGRPVKGQRARGSDLS